MRYAYTEFDGQEFPTPDSLFSYDQIMDFILSYGDKALDAMTKMDPADAQILQKMLDEGLLDKVAGRFRLTPKAINAMQRKALMEIFAHLPRGTREGHPTTSPGAADERLESTKKYQYGDPIAQLDLNQTMRNAVARQQIENRKSKIENAPAIQLPIHLSESDLELHLVEGSTSVALCILIDLSGSMMRYGRYLAAKKVAMALSALVRQRFPQDTVDIVGFYSTATRIREEQLPLVMPKQISTHEYMIDVKIPLDQAHTTHQHFTNLQLGMQMARRILRARSAEQKLMFIITDGQPTAHVDGETLFLQYPPTRATALATLQESLLCMRAGIRIASFAMIEDYYGMEWVEFIDQMTRLCKGVAFYCASGDLASCVMESYLNGKRKKTYIASTWRALPERKPMTRKTAIHDSSGNVFADLGVENPEEYLAKSELAARILQIIQSRRLTQSAAARILGITQPKVSALLRGNLDGFSTDRLFRFLNRLGCDVQINILPPRPRARGRTQVLV